MVGAPRSTPGSPRTWRGSRDSGRSPAANRNVRRVSFTLFGLTLVGLLAWLLWWWAFLPSVHLVCVPIVDYDVLAVPPLPFALEDAEAISGGSPRRPAVVLRDLQTSDSITTLGNRLQGLVTRPKDVLILYLTAHGVADDGAAYVLCSDYLRKTAAGRYKLADLLGQVQRCPAALKLLILDAGPLATDPRLGMLVNEFPRLL